MAIYPEFIAKFSFSPMIIGTGPDSGESADSGDLIIAGPKTRNPKTPKDLGGQFKVSGKSATGTARWFYRMCTVSGGVAKNPFFEQNYTDGIAIDYSNDLCLALYVKVISHNGDTQGFTNMQNYSMNGEHNTAGLVVVTSLNSHDSTEDGSSYLLVGESIAYKFPLTSDNFSSGIAPLETQKLRDIILDEMSDGTGSTCIAEIAALCDDVA